MPKPLKILQEVYQIGGAEISHPYDCSVYLFVAGGELVLIDCGAGPGFARLLANIKELGFDPANLKAILVTHAHIDHIGALHAFRESFGARVIAHELDADKIERGRGAGADFYGVEQVPCPVDYRITLAEDTLRFGDCELKTIHVPGHTPGSIAAYVDINKKRVLFGQDIHGPYNPEWGADPAQARKSLGKLLDLRADILCEGHFGVFQPAAAVQSYIKGYLDSL